MFLKVFQSIHSPRSTTLFTSRTTAQSPRHAACVTQVLSASLGDAVNVQTALRRADGLSRAAFAAALQRSVGLGHWDVADVSPGESSELDGPKSRN